ncbi:THAP domain-containing protein 8 isoform X2 [Strigops habroptila]|uniref:THAP domain containing 8 n=1 Tax=Strigops habroptila TaxID=2489341 RepID=A0A672URL8_STRHB|nr:THAP domain-containing protein 8 isoform X2 [Strigops habroptila]
MPKSCRAPRCSNAAGQARTAARGVSFYRFPLQDAPRLRQWLERMGQENWVPTRHQHLCSDHFEPSCFQYRWGVRYLRPDAVPTIFPCAPPRPSSTTRPEEPLAASGAEPVPPHQPLVPAEPAPAPQPEEHPAAPGGPAVVAPVELSTQELVAVALVLQRKVKVLQQRHRRHRARLEAMEGLVERLRREDRPGGGPPVSCLQPELPPPAAVTIICGEEEEEPLVYAVPPPVGTTCGLSPEQP